MDDKRNSSDRMSRRKPRLVTPMSSTEKILYERDKEGSDPPETFHITVKLLPPEAWTGSAASITGLLSKSFWQESPHHSGSEEEEVIEAHLETGNSNPWVTEYEI